MCPPRLARNFARTALPKPRIESQLWRISMSRKVLALLLAAGAAAATLGCEGDRFSPLAWRPAQATQAAGRGSARALPDVISLVEQYGPAVVNISTTANVRTRAQEFQIPGEPGDPFYEFFRRFQIPMPQGDTIRRGVGS